MWEFVIDEQNGELATQESGLLYAMEVFHVSLSQEEEKLQYEDDVVLGLKISKVKLSLTNVISYSVMVIHQGHFGGQ